MIVSRPLRFLLRVAGELALTLSVSSAADAQSFISPFIGYNFGGDAGCPAISELRG